MPVTIDLCPLGSRLAPLPVSPPAGGERLQGHHPADPGHPLPAGGLRVPEQHGRFHPGLCRPHYHRLGLSDLSQDLQPDFPREKPDLLLTSASASGRIPVTCSVWGPGPFLCMEVQVPEVPRVVVGATHMGGPSTAPGVPRLLIPTPQQVELTEHVRWMGKRAVESDLWPCPASRPSCAVSLMGNMS